MKIPWLNSAPTPAGRPYDWLENASQTDTGTSGGLWDKLFRGGMVAGLYRLFTAVVVLGFVITLILRCIRAMYNAGEPTEKASFKKYLAMWVVCFITFFLVRYIVSVFLKLGGAL